MNVYSDHPSFMNMVGIQTFISYFSNGHANQCKMSYFHGYINDLIM